MQVVLTAGGGYVFHSFLGPVLLQADLLAVQASSLDFGVASSPSLGWFCSIDAAFWSICRDWSWR